MNLTLRIDDSGLQVLRGKFLEQAVMGAAKKAGADARDRMRTDASRHVRERKNIALSKVRKLIKPLPLTEKQAKQMRWVLDVSGEFAGVIDYKPRQTKRGISVEINRGKRVLIPHAFKATMKSGHEGVFVRYGARSYAPMQGLYKGQDRYRGQRRQAIRELYTSRVVDPLLDPGQVEAIQQRASIAFGETWRRVMPMELARAVQAQGKAVLLSTRRART